MKLSEFPDQLFRMLSREESDLELPVINATICIGLKRGENIIMHQWEYKSKEKILAPLSLFKEPKK